jgi:myo-inositol 2-dehydrogenase/D-chiro-inositol 1-dehydrogenase
MTATITRFGLVGTGRIGQVHAASIAASPNAVLSRVADPNLESAKDAARQYGGVATASASDLIESGDIDALLVATPTPTHIDLISAAIDAGLPVLCEKPIDLDITRVDRLRERVAAAGIPVAIGFNRRFDPAFASTRARVAAGEIGTIEQLSIISRDHFPPPPDFVKVSGGIFRDMSIHDLDMARFFIPDIVTVFAAGANLFDRAAGENEDFDTAFITLRSASGALVSITNSRHSAIGYDQRIEAFGALGSLQVSNALTSLVSLSTALAVESKPPYQDFFLERYAVAYAVELEEFIKLVRGEPSISPTFEDGRAALLLADAAQRSAVEGISVPVDLS